jgi:hypothetical protein
MRTLERNTTSTYSRFIQVYFITFLFVVSGVLCLLLYSYIQKERNKEQIEHIEELQSILSDLDRNVNRQLADGFLKTHDVFIEFGDFHDQNIEHIGLKNIKVLDSLSRIADVLKYFKTDPEQQHNIEIIKNLNQLDELLLNTDEHSLYEKGDSKITLSKKGIEFKSSWILLTHLLERSYIQSIHDHNLKVEQNKKTLYLTAIISIIVLIGFTVYLSFVFYFKLLSNLFVIKKSLLKLTKGDSPKIEDSTLTGEIQYIQDDIEIVYDNYRQTDEVLSLLYSNHEISDLELDNFKSNVFYDSVFKLRTQLKSLETEEKNRNWHLNGISVLTDVANKFSGEPKILFEQFLISIVHYINAVQGGVFVKENEDIMSLEASYAFDRIKKKNRVLSKGEGLLGEVWQEEKTHYIENVSSEHFYVKSSLGEATATSVIIVPLIERGECFGVLELSVFQKMNENTRNFIIKASEILASATANVKVNQKTKQLLRDTQFLAEKLKIQEEENIKKIEDLKGHIEEEQHRLFLKDVEIKNKKMLLDQSINEVNQLKSKIAENEIKFDEKLIQASTNSQLVTDLKAQNEILSKEIVDLKETIHIRNVKIDRMKKKIESSK